MTYQQSLSDLGKQADDELTEALGQVQSANARIDALQTALNSTQGLLADANTKVSDQQAQIAALTLREPLFGAKPDPNTEANYAASVKRAGVPYKVHRHYSNSWSQTVSIVAACTAKVCAVTTSTLKDGALPVNATQIAAIKDRDGVILGFHHEPEDDIDVGKLTLAAYLAAQQKFATAVDAANKVRKNPLRKNLCLMGFTWRGANDKHKPEDFWQPIYDSLGTDVYPGIIDADDQFINPAVLFGSEVAFGKAHGVDVCVMEWGITTTENGRATYIRAVNNYARLNNIFAVSYWDHQDCRLLTDDEFAAAGGA